MALFTYRFDNFRTGANLFEFQLSQANVNSASFGKLFERSVDGSVYGQPLVVPNFIVGNEKHNVLIVVTMHNSVYAFDANEPSVTSPLWHQQLGESIQLPANDIGPLNYLDIEWEVGIVSTPVITVTDDVGTLWCVTTERSGGPQNAPSHTLWKLNLSDGSKLTSKTIGPILSNGATFTSNTQIQRPALTLANNRIYVSFASYGDAGNYFGWVLAFDSDSLEAKEVFSSTSAQSKRGGIWMAGQGPAVDKAGNIYLLTGNADFNLTTGDYGDSLLKLSPDLHLLDFFSPHNTEALNERDEDLGSGGVLIIPDSDLCCGGGKENFLYLFNQSSLGHADLDGPGYVGTDNVLGKVNVSANVSPGSEHHIHGAPTYYSGPYGTRLYVWAENDNLKAYSLDANAISQNPISTSQINDPDNTPGGSIGMPGGFHALSANGNVQESGILWASHPYTGNANQNIKPGVLRAFDPHDLTKQLWHSRQNTLRDDYGNYAKYNPPVPLGGNVYQATMGGLQQNQDSGEPTNAGPVLVSQDDEQLVMAWNSVDQPSLMTIVTSSDGFVWNPKYTIASEGTSGSPGLAYDPSTKTTFIAWSGDDPQHTINILQSNAPALNLWKNKHSILGSVSAYGPSLAYGSGQLFVAWADDTAMGSLNVASTKDGGATWHAQTRLPENSYAKPSLVFNNNILILSWTSIIPSQQLSFAECTNFDTLEFGDKVVISDPGNMAGDPGVISNQSTSVAFDATGFLWLSWVTTSKDTTSNGVLNQIVSEEGTISSLADIPNYHRQFRGNQAKSGPALCYFGSKMFVAWQDFNMPFHVQTAVLNRGSVAVYGLL